MVGLQSSTDPAPVLLVLDLSGSPRVARRDGVTHEAYTWAVHGDPTLLVRTPDGLGFNVNRYGTRTESAGSHSVSRRLLGELFPDMVVMASGCSRFDGVNPRRAW